MKYQNIIYGIHAIEAIIKKKSPKVKQLYLQEDKTNARLNKLQLLAKKNNIPVKNSSKKEMDTLSQHGIHQGALIECSEQTIYSESDLPQFLAALEKPALILLLDSIEDPHNLGACLRSANAAGVDMVIAPKHRAAGITPVVHKAASGALSSTPFMQVNNLANIIRFLKTKNIWVIGAAGEATESLYDTDFSVPMALVLGGEGTGLRRLIKQECDILVHIPMLGTVSSLNVSVSAGVCLFEVVRQRAEK